MPTRYYSNTALPTTLTADITAGQTVIGVAATTGFPTSFPFTLVIDKTVGGKAEAIDVTAVAGLNLTVVRGADGTAAVAHTAGAILTHDHTARDYRYAQDALDRLGGGVAATPLNATTKGLVVQGAASQSANLQEWQSSAGTALTSITPNGTLYASNGGVFTLAASGDAAAYRGYLYTQDATRKGLIIQGATSQSASLQEWQDSTGAVLATVDSNGKVNASRGLTIAGRAGDNSIFGQHGAAGQVAIIMRGAAAQTVNLQEWQSSAGTLLASVRSDGSITAGTGTTLLIGAGSYGGSVNAVPQATQAAGIIVRGLASQTGNLQEWQNSSGAVLARIGCDGGVEVGYVQSLSNSAYLDFRATGTNQQLVVVGSNTSAVPFRVQGNTGQVSALQEWGLSGTTVSYVQSGGTYTVASRRATKTAIRPIETDVLDRLRGLTIVGYRPVDHPDHEEIFSLVAEDAHEIMPEVVSHHHETGDPMGINTQGFMAMIAVAVQELSQQVDELRGLVNT